jgi:hypothetical protein
MKGTPDPIWDALVAAFGYTPITRSERGKWNRAAKDLRDAAIDPADIAKRVAEYRRRWPGINCNPLALAAHWGELAPRQAGDLVREVEAFAWARRQWALADVLEDAQRFTRGADAVAPSFVDAIVMRVLAPKRPASGHGGIIHPISPESGG